MKYTTAMQFLYFNSFFKFLGIQERLEPSPDYFFVNASPVLFNKNGFLRFRIYF
jgi:hypothetical protein